MFIRRRRRVKQKFADLLRLDNPAIRRPNSTSWSFIHRPSEDQSGGAVWITHEWRRDARQLAVGGKPDIVGGKQISQLRVGQQLNFVLRRDARRALPDV